MRSTKVASTALPEDNEGRGLYSAHPTACLSSFIYISRPSSSMEVQVDITSHFPSLRLFVFAFLRRIRTSKTPTRLRSSNSSYRNVQHLQIEQSLTIYHTRWLQNDASSGTTPIPTIAPVKWTKSTSTVPCTLLATGMPGRHPSSKAALHSAL